MSIRPGRFLCGLLPLVAATLANAGIRSPGTLTFQDRVSAQRVLDRLEYSHRVGATGSFDEAIPSRMSEDRVRAALARSAALESYWAMPITQAVLQKELERIARDTRLPERLIEIYAALGNDPFLVREAFVRPFLVDRLVRGFLASDERIQASPRARAERLRASLVAGRLSARDRHPLRELVKSPVAEPRDTWQDPDAVGHLLDVHDAFRFEVLLEQGPGFETIAVYRKGIHGNGWAL